MTIMAEDLNKKSEELQEEQLDEVSGGSFRDKLNEIINKSKVDYQPKPITNPSIDHIKDLINQHKGS